MWLKQSQHRFFVPEGRTRHSPEDKRAHASSGPLRRPCSCRLRSPAPGAPSPANCGGVPLPPSLLCNFRLLKTATRDFPFRLRPFNLNERKAIATKKQNNHPKALSIYKKRWSKGIFFLDCSRDWVCVFHFSVSIPGSHTWFSEQHSPVAGNIQGRRKALLSDWAPIQPSTLNEAGKCLGDAAAFLKHSRLVF